MSTSSGVGNRLRHPAEVPFHAFMVLLNLRQGRAPRGFRVELAQLPLSHPFTVRRRERLFRLGLPHSRAHQNISK